jgi:hypothetical protein
MKSKATIIVNSDEIAALIERIEYAPPSAEDCILTMRLLRLLISLLQEMDAKNASLANLRRLLFGSKSEKRRIGKSSHSTTEINVPSDELASCQDSKYCDQPSNLPSDLPSAMGSASEPDVAQKRKPGHGRLGADQYTAAKIVNCFNSDLRPGNKCPNEHCRGHLYDTNEPQVLIKREARPIIDAIRYEREVLRCSFCQQRFAANLPENVSEEKFDTTADVMIALLKYGAAMPFYRLERIQAIMGMPLPASTQFERCELVAKAVHPVFLELERQAAQSELLHSDDTGVRILSLMKENELVAKKERKGMYTTGIGARSAKFDIALYYSGRMYAGENLDQLLIKRADDLTEPILMADAENKNWSKKFRAIIAKCLAHGRRKFVDCSPAFPTECGKVLDDLAEIYCIDAQAKAMTPEERLAHHQQLSLPIMTKLKQWMEEQIAVHKKEPNSSLGKAIKYMLKHWKYLTRFLDVAGCPVDNNFIERSLRKAVILRKNSLFYKTEHGAAIGDILLSIIETCALNKINPFDYLLTLVNNGREVRARPAAWLPWNYQLKKQKVA